MSSVEYDFLFKLNLEVFTVDLNTSLKRFDLV